MIVRFLFDYSLYKEERKKPFRSTVVYDVYKSLLEQKYIIKAVIFKSRLVGWTILKYTAINKKIRNRRIEI